MKNKFVFRELRKKYDSKRLCLGRRALVPHGIRRGIDFPAGERAAHAIGVGGGAVIFIIANGGRVVLRATAKFAVAIGHFIGAPEGEEAKCNGG